MPYSRSHRGTVYGLIVLFCSWWRTFPLLALGFDDNVILHERSLNSISLGTGCFLQQTSVWNNSTHMSALMQASSAPPVLCSSKINFLEMKQGLTGGSNKMPSEKETISVIFSEFYSDWCCQCACASRNWDQLYTHFTTHSWLL